MTAEKYLQVVLGYIRSKDARPFVKQELQQHLQHAQQAWMAQGYTKVDAERKAVEHMGSAVALGKSMNNIYKPKIDWWLIIAVIGLFGCSMLPLLSLSQLYNVETIAALQTAQLRNVVVGLVIIVTLSFLKVRHLQKVALLLYWLAIIILMAIVLFPTYINGQPYILNGMFSPIATLPLLAVGLAMVLSIKPPLWLSLLAFTYPLILFLAMTATTTLFLYVILAFILFFYSHYTWRTKLMVSGMSVIVVLAALIFLVPWSVNQFERITAFLQPTDFAATSGYVYMQITEVLAQAQWFGRAQGEALASGFTDLVFIDVIQTYGYAVAFVIVSLLAIVIYRCFRITFNMQTSFLRLLLVAITTVLIVQIIYSISMSLGFLPILSISLPFVSYGSEPIVLNALLIGIVLAVYRKHHYAI